tara:strand:+ start:90 stop:272 length:183 start_codon:yes stop_codon:yes gene_type:complete
MKFKQWILEENKRTGTFTKLTKSIGNFYQNIYVLKQCDGEEINEIVITKKDIDKIRNIIK